MEAHVVGGEQTNAALAIDVGRVLSKAQRERVHLRLGALDGDAGLEPRFDEPRAAGRALEPARVVTRRVEEVDHGCRRPKRRRETRERRRERRDADDVERSPVELDRLPDDVGRRSQTRAPKRLADDGDRMASGRHVIARLEGAAEDHGDADELEEVSGGDFAEQVLVRTARAVERHRRLKCRDAGENFVAIAVRLVVRVRRHTVRIAGRVAQIQVHQALGLDAGFGREQNRVDGAENGGVEPDAERERYDGDEREPRALDEHATPEADVLKQIVHGISVVHQYGERVLEVHGILLFAGGECAELVDGRFHLVFGDVALPHQP